MLGVLDSCYMRFTCARSCQSLVRTFLCGPNVIHLATCTLCVLGVVDPCCVLFACVVLILDVCVLCALSVVNPCCAFLACA
jgi:hypothetical protein